MLTHHPTRAGARRRGAAAVLAAVVLLLGSACSDDDGTGDTATDASSDTPASATPTPETEPTEPAPTESASATPSTPPRPDCAEVWVAGRKLPRPYKGCLEDGVLVEPDAFYCSFGAPLVIYAKKFYAVVGRKVNEVGTTLAKDPGYRAAIRACTA
ncbi:hypothetical protein [Nocardioides sp. SYSU D00038]|uniref:hypothetical protein n=1 Tax=Nocardioides sp. SYSU D00038 TaxID=2812554 RepID=UPI001967E434|nr:hypothetical protein [Nocardioides sp. SYSU D00038]